MRNLSNTNYIKSVLLLAVGIYIIVLVLGLVHNASLKRTITIESTKQHGVVVIRNIKHPTPYRTEQARISYTVTGPLEYLLIPSGIYQESILSAALKLVIAVLFGIFVWKFDFQEPFQVVFLDRAYLIYRLYIGSILLMWPVGWYLNDWSRHYFYNTDYHTYGSVSNLTNFMLLVVLLTVGIHLYTRAVKNKLELDLTI